MKTLQENGNEWKPLLQTKYILECIMMQRGERWVLFSSATLFFDSFQILVVVYFLLFLFLFFLLLQLLFISCVNISCLPVFFLNKVILLQLLFLLLDITLLLYPGNLYGKSVKCLLFLTQILQENKQHILYLLLRKKFKKQVKSFKNECWG